MVKNMSEDPNKQWKTQSELNKHLKAKKKRFVDDIDKTVADHLKKRDKVEANAKKLR